MAPQRFQRMSAKSHSNTYDKQHVQAQSYVEKKKIQELFSHLLQMVVYKKPDDPRAFMIEEIKKLQGAKPSKLFDQAELEMMFDLIDVTKQEKISLPQLRNAYANLSHDGSKLEDDQIPAAVLSSGVVKLQDFKDIMGKHLETKPHWK